MKRTYFYFPLSILLTCIVSCTAPKDPRKSFERATHDGLKVGVVNNPPYVSYDNGEISGSEIDMLHDFAEMENMELQFLKGSESVLIKKLEDAEIHIIVGGFSKKTSWKEKSGQTKPYDGEHVWLVPMGENRMVYVLESFFHEIDAK
ncbi:transporter substrate-binding domain-containing protein [Algoriphagus sp.]|uniref:transporter substrate-binding domain-containing protein n=1 Tax=Algoriphagus sp. TaxID=1872435 RepID=UPI003F721F1C